MRRDRLTLSIALLALLAVSGSALALADCWPNGIPGTAGTGAVGLDFMFLPSDAPAVAYFEPVRKDLYYSFFNGIEWLATRVDRGGTVGLNPSLAANLLSIPGISYYNGSKKDLKFAWFDTDRQKWRSTTVDRKGNVGSASSLAFLSDGAAAIAYYDASRGDLKFAVSYKNNKKWRKTTIDNIGDVGNNPSLAVLGENRFAVAYAGNGAGLKYAWFDGTAWQNTIIDSSASASARSSLKVLGSGDSAVAYVGGDGYLKFAWFDGADWQKVTVDGDVSAGHDVSLTVLADGNPAIAYRNMTSGAVKYAWFDGADWQKAVVDVTGQTGYAGANRASVKTDGTPCMAYADWPNHCARLEDLSGPFVEPTTKQIIANVPEYEWRYGCAPTAAGMIIGFWDRTAYPNLVTGDMPASARAGMDDTVDSVIASDAHIDDPFYNYYWGLAGVSGYRYDKTNDGWLLRGAQPSRTPDCLADFMFTTTPYGGSMPYNIAWGMRNYAAAHPNGTEPLYFSVGIYADPTIDHLIGEIDAGRPVMLGLYTSDSGHAVVAYGYRIDAATGQYQFAIMDTWPDGATGSPPAPEGAERTTESVGGEDAIVEWWPWETMFGQRLGAGDEFQVNMLLTFTPVASEEDAIVTLYPAFDGSTPFCRYYYGFETPSGDGQCPYIGLMTLDETVIPEPFSAALALAGLTAAYFHRRYRAGIR